MVVVCLSVCLSVCLFVCHSVCPVPDPIVEKGRAYQAQKWQKEVHDVGDARPHLDVERSKVKVTRPINTNAPYLLKRRPTNFQLGTDGVR